MFKLRLEPLFRPESDVNEGGTKILPDGSGKEDLIDFLAEDDEKETIELEEKKKKEKTEQEVIPKDKRVPEETPEDEEDEEEDELKELEAELQEPTEEQLELVTPVKRREILKKYPNLFKDFPYLEKAYYREQQFTELLPTIDDAKAAVEKGQILDRFESDLMKGNAETILKAVKETNGSAFNKLVDDYLPTLAKVDEKAYYHVIGNLTKRTIIEMVGEAKRLGIGHDTEGKPYPGNNLQAAAHLLNQFVFGTSDFVPPSNLSREPNPEDNQREKQIQQREQGIVRQQFEDARGNLNTRVNNALRNTIEANIDPRSSMSDYVRKNASRDALDSLEVLINQDKRFKDLVDKLWEKAFESRFSRDSVERIRSAYVGKAKTLLPSVIKKARNEALRGTGKHVSDDSDDKNRKGPIPGGRPRSQPSGGKITKASDIPKGMSTLDFLNTD